MDGVLLGDIFFGKLDGMSESNKNNFNEFFYKGNSSYKQLVDDDSCFVICGRKGTGKTILAKYYAKELAKKNMVSTFIDANDILLSQLKEIQGENIERYKISAFVEYVILYEMAKTIINKKKVFVEKESFLKRKKLKKHIKELEIFMDERDCKSNYKIKEFSKETIQEIAATSELSLLKKSKAKSSLANKKTNLSCYVQNEFYSITENIKSKIIKITQNTSVTLVFDDLDEYADNIRTNDNFQHLILKLIYASRAINNEFKSENDYNPNKIFILMRSDILDSLHTEASNLQKINDCTIRINWLENLGESVKDNELIKMVLTKVKASSVKFSNMTFEQLFEKIFPPTIGGKETVKYFLEHTHGRPRDIVDMLNIARSKNKLAEKFTEAMFIKTEKEYSKSFKKSLLNEMSLYYDTQKIDECFNLLSFMSKQTFRIKDVEEVLDKYKKQLRNVSSAMEFIDIAYSFGIIGFHAKVDGKKYTYFSYREDGKEMINYNSKFTIHFGLIASIN